MPEACSVHVHVPSIVMSTYVFCSHQQVPCSDIPLSQNPTPRPHGNNLSLEDTQQEDKDLLCMTRGLATLIRISMYKVRMTVNPIHKETYYMHAYVLLVVVHSTSCCFVLGAISIHQDFYFNMCLCVSD